MERRRVLSDTVGPSMTKQAMKDECDVNYILSRFRATGQAPLGRGPGDYGDFSSGRDFQSAMNMLLAAQRSFAALPAKVRDYCRNDPAVFLDLVSDPERREELEALGLVKADVPPAAVLVRLEEVEKPEDEPPAKP